MGPLGSRKVSGVPEETFTAKGTCLFLYLKYLYLHKKLVCNLTAIYKGVIHHTQPPFSPSPPGQEDQGNLSPLSMAASLVQDFTPVTAPC